MGDPNDDMIIECRELERAIDLNLEYYGDGIPGTERAESQLIEECAELIHAISHYRRGRGDVTKVLAEMADVFIQLQLLLVVNGQSAGQLMEAVVATSNRITRRLEKRIQFDGTAAQAAEDDAAHPED